MNQAPGIVLVTTSFPIRGDGSEAAGAFVADLAEALAAHLPVRVVAPGALAGREKWSEGVVVFRYAAPERPLSTLRPWRLADLGQLLRVLGGGQAATREAVRAGPTAHVLALWALPSGHWARRVALQTGVPYSVWALGSDIWSLGRVPIVRTILARVLRGAVHRYADGLELATDTRRIANRDVEFLPSSRQMNKRRGEPVRDQPPYRLLFLGRWHPNKGVDLLIQALDLLEDGDWEKIELVSVFGGGALESEVDDGVRRLLKAGRPVRKGGYLTKTEAEEVMAGSDFLLIPSRIESIPVVFSDAMKLECPVIVTPVGDLKTLVGQGEVGFFARETTALAFCEAIRSALHAGAQAVSRERLVGMARRFDVDGVASMLAQRSFCSVQGSPP